MKKIPNMSGVLRGNFYEGFERVYQEELFNKRGAFSERLQQLLINEINI